MLQNAALKAGLGADEKRLALRRQRVPLAIFGEEVQPDQPVHDDSKSALRCSRRCRRLLHRLWPGIKDVEDAMVYCSFEKKGWHIAPAKLHDSFRRHGRARTH